MRDLCRPEILTLVRRTIPLSWKNAIVVASLVLTGCTTTGVTPESWQALFTAQQQELETARRSGEQARTELASIQQELGTARALKARWDGHDREWDRRLADIKKVVVAQREELVRSAREAKTLATALDTIKRDFVRLSEERTTLSGQVTRMEKEARTLTHAKARSGPASSPPARVAPVRPEITARRRSAHQDQILSATPTPSEAPSSSNTAALATREEVRSIPEGPRSQVVNTTQAVTEPAPAPAPIKKLLKEPALPRRSPEAPRTHTESSSRVGSTSGSGTRPASATGTRTQAEELDAWWRQKYQADMSPTRHP
jgi:ABC-type transporter Mla subunit MlaD